MRTLLHSKVRYALLGVVLVAGTLWALGPARSGAANTPLWTDGKPTASTAISPWIGVAKEDTAAVVNISTT
jgi:hypothetical protein